MANFKTHLTAAGIASGVLASTIYSSGLADSREMIMYWMMGTLGGILPDVDSDNSTAIKVVFTLLGSLVALIMLFSLNDRFALLELWIICGAALVITRFGVLMGFEQFSVHRGVFHSFLAGIFFWLLATAALGVKYPAETAWMAGFCVFFGYVIHLALDEVFAVDLMNGELKKSFGSAMKPFSLEQKGAS